MELYPHAIAFISIDIFENQMRQRWTYIECADRIFKLRFIAIRNRAQVDRVMR